MTSVVRPAALGLVFLLLLGAGCTGEDKPPFVPGDGPRKIDGTVQFLGVCTTDTDCASGKCLAMGGTKRCSRVCTGASPCPAFPTWSCKQGTCECSGTGKQPTVCNADGDCDGVADRTPAKESCNGEDDDCNGKIDDVSEGVAGAKLYYKDADGDGHGDQNASRWSCTAEAGWVETKGDCDDARKDVNPSITEVCGDGVDHDCDGTKEDADVCGLIPIVVPDVNDTQYQSATLKTCTAGGDKPYDVTEIVAKQDKNAIKFTVRLAGAPATTACATYAIHLGTFAKVYEMVYLYRPGGATCSPALPELEVYFKGQKQTTKATTAFNAADPGHVSFTIPKTEYFPSLTTPTYYLKACANAKADAVKDLTDCVSDSCETPVHR